jgi:hypothetical protein
MSNYTIAVNWAGKDALSDSDPDKVISGTDFNTEFVAIRTAVNTKADLNGNSAENFSVNDLTVTNDVSVGNDLTVTNDVTVTNDLTVTNDVSVGNDLTISGNTTIVEFTETVVALSGTTPSITTTNGTVLTWTLSGNSTPTDGLSDGQAVVLMIDDGSAYTITWTSLVDQWQGGSAPTLATSGYTVVVIWKVGSTVYGASVGAMS